LLKIQDKSFQIEKIRLKTVRPFVMDDLVLADVAESEGVPLENKIQVNKYLKTRVSRLSSSPWQSCSSRAIQVNELIEKANEEWDELHAEDEEKPQRMLPLIRLRVREETIERGNDLLTAILDQVEYTGYEVGNPQRFGQDFTNKVANPRDIVQFYKKKVLASRGKKITIDLPEGLDPANFEGELPEKIEKIKVETLVRQYLEAQTLQVLHENGIGYAINAFVEKDDKHAIDSCVRRLNRWYLAHGWVYDLAS